MCGWWFQRGIPANNPCEDVMSKILELEATIDELSQTMTQVLAAKDAEIAHLLAQVVVVAAGAITDEQIDGVILKLGQIQAQITPPQTP